MNPSNPANCTVAIVAPTGRDIRAAEKRAMPAAVACRLTAGMAAALAAVSGKLSS